MRRIVVVVGSIIVMAAVLGFSRIITTWKVHARTSKFNADVENLFVGLQTYKENVGAYPQGGNAEIAKALRGHNPKNVIILMGRKNELNAKGEFVDPWGTPLRIYFCDSGIMVRSAGPNCRFDDSSSMECDDYFRAN